MSQVYQPWNLLLLAVPALGAYGIWFLLHQILFGFFAYRFVRKIGSSHVAGLVAVVSVVLGLCAVLVARITGMMVGDARFPLVNRLLSILARRR